MRTFPLIVALLLLVSLEAPAQDDQRRYAFAQSYVGLAYQQIPADGRVVEFAGSDPIRTSFPRMGQARLVIGGLHFWQHAEFYVAVPLTSTLGQSARGYSYEFSGTATGARFLPFGIEEQSIRPYLGLGWNVKNVTQEPEGDADVPTIQEHFFYLEGG